MRVSALGLALGALAGPAAAGDLADYRVYDSSDYSAQAYYRLEFGGAQGHAQSLGLRFDNERAMAAGMPSLVQAHFGSQGLDRLALNGVDLRGAMLASGQDSGGGFFGSLSVAQWVAVGFTVIVFGSVASDAAESGPEEPVSGSGSGGG